MTPSHASQVGAARAGEGGEMRIGNTVYLRSVLSHIKNIYEHSDTKWEDKYDTIFRLGRGLNEAGFGVEWYDPDTSYQEDVQAYVQALRDKYGDIWDGLDDKVIHVERIELTAEQRRGLTVNIASLPDAAPNERERVSDTTMVWNRCEDELPTVQDNYIVYDEQGVGFAFWSIRGGQGEWIGYEKATAKPQTVTHWMALPDPPDD